VHVSETFKKVEKFSINWHLVALLINDCWFVQNSFPLPTSELSHGFYLVLPGPPSNLECLLKDFNVAFCRWDHDPSKYIGDGEYRTPTNYIITYNSMDRLVNFYFFSNNCFRHKLTLHAVECSYDKIESYNYFIECITKLAFDQFDYYNFINIAITFLWCAMRIDELKFLPFEKSKVTFCVKKTSSTSTAFQFWNAIRFQWVMSSVALAREKWGK